jgi:hypothetical protein
MKSQKAKEKIFEIRSSQRDKQGHQGNTDEKSV